MENIRKIENDIYRIGASDRKLQIFEATYPISNGMAYNSYFIDDEKTAIIDTVDKHCAKQFFENVKAVLKNRKLDYLIVQHMEPDHAALICDLVEKYPETTVVCSQKASDMLSQFFCLENFANFNIVKEGDNLSLGKHQLTFVNAPMVHWPEVIVTYDETSKTLFSADAFGSFGAVNGNITDEEYEIGEEYINEARRYYTNIVGKYGPQVQNLLKKASGLEIKSICPLHGLIIKKNIGLFIEKYDKWSKYEPEENSVVIAYSSVYGNTENAVEVLASKLAEKGVKNIKMFDTSMTHYSFILAEMFKASHIVLATTTYNMGIFVTMEHLINNMVSHNLKNRKFAIIENGSWASCCGKLVKESLEKLAGSEILNEESLTIKSSLTSNQSEDIKKLSEIIVESLNRRV